MQIELRIKNKKIKTLKIIIIKEIIIINTIKYMHIILQLIILIFNTDRLRKLYEAY